MKRIFIAFSAVLATTLLISSHAANAQQLSLGQITNYLNSMRAAQAKFVQANPDKTLAQGVLYIQKPGKIRYEYTTPADSLVISDGRTLGVFDKKSNRGPQRYDLKRTPLDILLKVELRQWIVTDRSGKNTTVILNDLKLRNGVKADLFDIKKATAALER